MIVLEEKMSVHYSRSEQAILDIMKARKEPMSVQDIAEVYYTTHPPKPFNSEKTIQGSIYTLMRKIEMNKEAFIIERVRKPGVRAILYRIKRRR